MFLSHREALPFISTNVYVCMYVCMYVCVCVCVCVRSFVRSCMRVGVRTCVRVHVMYVTTTTHKYNSLKNITIGSELIIYRKINT